jgi:hypothetical protein
MMVCISLDCKRMPLFSFLTAKLQIPLHIS